MSNKSSPELEMLDPKPGESSLHDEAYAPDSIIVPDWVSKKYQSRLLRLTVYAHPPSCAYALASLPPNATWSNNPLFQRYLCVNHSPLTIYGLGSLHDLTFSLACGQPPRFSVSIDLIRNGDRDLLSKVYRRARPRRVNKPTYFTATPALADERASFCAIYDATSGLRPKQDMEHVNLASLTPGDILLLETSFIRKMLTDITWTVSFELEAILVLVKAPRTSTRTVNL